MNKLLAYLLIAILAISSFNAIPRVAGQNPAQQKATDSLIMQLKLWEARYRNDMVTEVLEKLFRVDPDHVYGLEVYAREQIRLGNLQQAQWAIEKINLIDKNNSAVTRLRTLHRLHTKDKNALQQARIFALGGRSQKAIEAFDQLFQGPPPTPDLALEYWQLIYQAGQRDKAARELKALSDRYPDNTRFRVAFISTEIEKDDFDLKYLEELSLLGRNPITDLEAIRIWRRAIGNLPARESSVPYFQDYLRFSPSDNAIHSQLAQITGEIRELKILEQNPYFIAKHQGLAALNNEQLTLAERKFNYALENYPNDPEIIGGLGYVKMRQGLRYRAIQYFKQALKHDPDNQDQWNSLITTNQFWSYLAQADLAVEQAKPKQAEKYINLAAKLSPEDPEIYVSRAALASSRADYKRAKRLYRQALRKEPSNSSAIRGLLRQYSLLGQRHEALRFIEGLQDDQRKENREVIIGLQAEFLQQDASKLLAPKQQKIALKKLQQALKLTPDDPWLRYDIAKRLATQNRLSEAHALYAGRINKKTKDADLLYSYSLFLSSIDEDEQALAWLRQIRQQDYTDGIISLQQRLSLNKILIKAEQSADFDTAQSYMQQALAIAKQNEDLFISLANSWRRQGSYAQALEAMKHYLAFQGRNQQQPDNDTLSSYINLLIADNRQPQAIRQLTQLASQPDISFNERLDIADIFLELSTANDNDESFLIRAEHILNRIPTANQNKLDLLNARLELAQIRQDHPKIVAISQQILQNYPEQRAIRLDLIERFTDRNQKAKAQVHIDYLAADYQNLDDAQQIELLDYIDANDPQLQQRITQRLAKAPLNADIYDLAVNNISSKTSAIDANRLFQRAIITRRIENILEQAGLQSISQLTLAQARRNLVQQNLTTLGKEQPINQALILLEQFSQVEHSDLAIVDDDWASDNYQVASLKSDMAQNWRESLDYIEVGFDWREKDGADGQSQLKAFNMPIEARFQLEEGGSWFFRVEPVLLHAGNVIMDDANQNANPNEQFGAVLLCQIEALCVDGYIEQKQFGASLAIGIEKDNWKADIGTIPINFEFNDWVGGFEYSGDIGEFYWSAELAKRPVASSLLSFSGTYDPYSGRKWGGVTYKGINFGFGYDQGEALGIWSNASYHLISGNNVADNSRAALMGGVYYRLLTENPFQLTVGLNALTWSYDKDLSEYSFGQGGYYSPQSYVSLSLPIDLFGRYGDLSYLLRVIPSISKTTDDFSLYYPTEPNYQNLALQVENEPIYLGDAEGEPSAGMSYQAAIEWHFAKRWTVGASFSIERSDFYEPSHGMIYFRYALDDLPMILYTPPKPVKLYQDF